MYPHVTDLIHPAATNPQYLTLIPEKNQGLFRVTTTASYANAIAAIRISFCNRCLDNVGFSVSNR